MSVPRYPTIDLSWERILERRWAVSADESYARELLEVSAAPDKDAPTPNIHYRVWYVGAKLIEQNLTTQRITEADGAKFTRLQPVIDSLLNSQRQYDEANDLAIPPGFEAIPSDCDRCDTRVTGSGGEALRRPRTLKTSRR